MEDQSRNNQNSIIQPDQPQHMRMHIDREEDSCLVPDDEPCEAQTISHSHEINSHLKSGWTWSPHTTWNVSPLSNESECDERSHHASIVVTTSTENSQAHEDTNIVKPRDLILVLGGLHTPNVSSVLVGEVPTSASLGWLPPAPSANPMDGPPSRTLRQQDPISWREGPALNDSRLDLAAVACNGHVYAIGGVGLDTMERIPISVLAQPHYFNRYTKSLDQWTTLPCRLSCCGHGCVAVTVQDRYIVVLARGGSGAAEIVDTQSTTLYHGLEQTCLAVMVGVSLNYIRVPLGVTTVENEVWAMGRTTSDATSSGIQVEKLAFEIDHDRNGTVSFASSWHTCDNEFREFQHDTETEWHGPALVKIGNNPLLIVSSPRSNQDGQPQSAFLRVYDVQCRSSCSLPKLVHSRQFYSVVTFATRTCQSLRSRNWQILVLGGQSDNIHDGDKTTTPLLPFMESTTLVQLTLPGMKQQIHGLEESYNPTLMQLVFEDMKVKSQGHDRTNAFKQKCQQQSSERDRIKRLLDTYVFYLMARKKAVAHLLIQWERC